MASSPIREFTKRQAEIAHGILRGLSYKQIGAELGIKGSTVRERVKEMSNNFFDSDSKKAFPPRQCILVWTVVLQVKLRRTPTVDDIYCASRESGVRYAAAIHASETRESATVAE